MSMIDGKLRVLQMVDRHGSVTAAATAMKYTPSAVSYQLRQLAEQLGVKLVEPAGRGIKLTAAARTVLRHTAVMQAQWEQARSELAATSEESSGLFTLCGFSTAATHLLPLAAATLHDRHPRLRVRVVEAEPARCFELLEAEEADLALVMVTADSPSLSDGRFDQQSLLDDPLDLVVHAEHPLAARPTVTLADAAREPWIIGTPGGAYHQLTVTACVAAGFAPDIAHQADEWETGAALVAHRLGVMLIPRLGLINTEWPVTRIRLSGEPVPARRILATTRKGGAGHPLVAQTLDLIQVASSSLFSGGVPRGTPSARAE
ncbi:LysR family transcriptional regulator [Geodermatophilus sp. CPCC 205761]|uniref:LysR family transcriptional regulator n=1 Tax=Geodermatophilus sp. CPCC 205761 TaxID=2936597 RepID=UPI003EECAA65